MLTSSPPRAAAFDRRAGFPVTAIARGHRIPTALAGAAVVLVAVRFAPGLVSLPEIAASIAVQTRTTTLAALLVVIFLLQAAHEPAPALLRSAPRPWIALRMLRLLTVTVAGTALVAALSSAPVHTEAVVLFLLGEGLLLTRLAGLALGWALPVVHVLAAAVVGVGQRGEPFFWAWFLRPSATAADVVAAVACYGIGLTLWAAHLSGQD